MREGVATTGPVRCASYGETTLATQAHNPSTRRDFLFVATGAVAGVGVAATVWPLINQLNPDAST
ncbi:MAG: twin-arginine translocation signal domain-containing protein, partial [Acetobacteraceae bacterium]